MLLKKPFARSWCCCGSACGIVGEETAEDGGWRVAAVMHLRTHCGESLQQTGLLSLVAGGAGDDWR